MKKKNIYFIDTSAMATLGNGQKTYVPITFHLVTNNLEQDLAKAKDAKGLVFSKYCSTEEIGTAYEEIGPHPATSFMGIKFVENTIREVHVFNTDNLEVVTAHDTYNISYGHLFGEKKKNVVERFFTDLGIKR